MLCAVHDVVLCALLLQHNARHHITAIAHCNRDDDVYMYAHLHYVWRS